MSLVTFGRHGNYTIDSRYVAVAYDTTITPIWKRRHSDEIAIIGRTGSCHYNNIQCSQRRKPHQNGDNFAQITQYERKKVFILRIKNSQRTLHISPSRTSHGASFRFQRERKPYKCIHVLRDIGSVLYKDMLLKTMETSREMNFTKSRDMKTSAPEASIPGRDKQTAFHRVLWFAITHPCPRQPPPAPKPTGVIN